MAKKVEVLYSVVDQATSQMKGIEKEFNGMQSTVGNFVKAVGGIAAGGYITSRVIGGLKDMTSEALAFGDQMTNVSNRMGIAVEDAQMLNFVSGQTGTTLEALSKPMKDLAVNSYAAANGNEKAAKKFSELGVSVRDSYGNLKSVGTLFNETVTALSRVENTTERTAKAADMFGKSASSVLQIAAEGPDKLAGLTKSFEDMGGALSREDISRLDDAGDSMKRMQDSMALLGAEMTATFSPAITAAANALAGFFATFRSPSEQGKVKEAEEIITKLQAQLTRFEGQLEKSKQGGFWNRLIAGGQDYNQGLIDQVKKEMTEWNRILEERKKVLSDSQGVVNPPADDDPDSESAEKKEAAMLRAIDKASKIREDAEFADAQARFDAQEKEKKDKVDFNNWEVQQQNKADAILLRMSDEFTRRKKENAEQEQQIESAKYNFQKDISLSSIEVMGQATQAMARNATERKEAALLEIIAYGAVSSALAWKEAFAQSDTGGFYGKLAAAIVGTAAAVVNTAVAIGNLNANAQGTNNFEGGPTRINENGPEIVQLPSGTVIHNSTKSADMDRRAGGESMQPLIVNFHHQQDVVETFRTKIRSGQARGFLQDLRGAMV
jgi:hypothetical protein